MHPIGDREKLLDEIAERELRDTDHFEEKCRQRQHISSEDIRKKISGDLEDDLLAFTYKEDDYVGDRYNLALDRSNKYYLIIGLSFVNNHLNIVTAFITSRDKGKPEELVERFG